MKTIIAGSRSFNSFELLQAAIKSCPFPLASVISGGAKGVDTLGEEYVRRVGVPLNCIAFHPLSSSTPWEAEEFDRSRLVTV